MNLSSLFKLLFCCISFVLALVYIFRFFEAAFPVITIPIVEDREKLLEVSKDVLSRFGLCPFNGPPSHAILFHTDTSAQKFIEWTTNQTYYNNLIQEEAYYFYNWHVRFFQESEECETWIFFNSVLKPLGFANVLPESYNFEGFESDEEVVNVEKKDTDDIISEAVEEFFPLSEYEYAVHSTEEVISGRVDHSFVFEKVLGKVKSLENQPAPSLAAESIIEGDIDRLKDDLIILKLTIDVSGNRVSRISQYMKVPEAFTIHYELCRSQNSTLSLFSNVLFLVSCSLLIVYGFITTIRKYFILNHHIRKAVILGTLFSFLLNVLMNFNQLPEQWITYPTNIPKIVFISKFISESLVRFLFHSVTFSIIIMCTEALNRLTFRNHIRFYRFIKNLTTWRSLKGVLLAYYLTIIMLAYEVFFYRFFRDSMDWWLPTEPHLDPNYFNHYQPWITCVVTSIEAGFLEELIFRALILSAAFQMGYRKGWFGYFLKCAGFSFQIFVFSAAHCNYPAQPYYARLVELILPSTMFGIIYLSEGFWVSVLIHYLYDLFWFSMSIFRSRSPNIWLYRLILVFFAILPLILFSIRFVFYTRRKITYEVDKKETNRGFLKERKRSRKKSKDKFAMYYKRFKRSGSLPRSGMAIVLILCPLLVFIFLKFVVLKIHNVPSKLEYDRNEASELIEEAFYAQLESRGLKPDSWHCFSKVSSELGSNDHDYILLAHPNRAHPKDPTDPSTGLPEEYFHLIEDGFLEDMYYSVRCFRMRVSDIYTFEFNQKRIFSLYHKFPEDTEIPSLEEEEVEEAALKRVQNYFKKGTNGTEEYVLVSKKSISRPNRVDWEVTYNVSDTCQVDIFLSGNQLSGIHKKVFVPDSFNRDREKRVSIISIFETLLNCVPLFVYLYAVMVGIKLWTRYQLDGMAFTYCSVILAVYSVSRTVISIPSVTENYVPDKLLLTQILSSLLVIGLRTFFVTFLIGIITSYTLFWKRKLDVNEKGKMSVVVFIICGIFCAVTEELVSIQCIVKVLFMLCEKCKQTLNLDVLRSVSIPRVKGEMIHDLNSYIPVISIGLRMGSKFCWDTAMEWFFVMWVLDYSPFWGSFVITFFGSVNPLKQLEIEPLQLQLILWAGAVVIRSLVTWGLFKVFYSRSINFVKYKVMFLLIIEVVRMKRRKVFDFSMVDYYVIIVVIVFTFLVHAICVDRKEKGEKEDKILLKKKKQE